MTIMRSTTRPRASARVREKGKTHRRILSSASSLMRREGLAGASVPRVMRGAGLTVGGFYAHFRSKQAMDAEVLRTTLAERRAAWFAGLEGSAGTAWLARAVKRYLSPTHRDAPHDGCPLPAVLSELGRADRRTREAAVEAIEAYARAIEERAREAERPGVGAGATPRERALATLALCIGGVALARAFGERPASDEVLRACARWALPDAP